MAPATVPTIRPYTADDIPALRAIQEASFPPPFPQSLLWTREQILSHIAQFPAGALCAEIDGAVVGSATALIRCWHADDPPHTWNEASDHGFLRNHDPYGTALYGVDIAVHPSARRQGVARALYQARYRLVRRLGLVAFVAGSRLSGYQHQRQRLSIQAYAAEVARGALHDPVITPQLRAGLRPVQLLTNYLSDEESADAALLMAWYPAEHAS